MISKADKPYSLFQKVKAYLHFLRLSTNRHGVHSPFVYNFIENVANYPYSDKAVEIERKKLTNDHSPITIKDFGMGEDRRSSLSKIAKKSLKKPKEAGLIARIVEYYNVRRVIELGSSLGITTAYIARSASSVKVKTIEGSEDILTIGRKIWKQLNLENIDSYNGEFDSILPKLFPLENEKFLFFIDGNHHFSSTLNYFNMIKKECNKESIFIFDDIHWSEGMEKAWDTIKNDREVSLSIDLFELGIVFINPRLKKEHFNIRY